MVWQVAFYFSEQNLQRDKFLLEKMKGRKNRPISIQIIADFPKMREYQPLSFVVEALRTSDAVNVVKVNGVDCVQRKVPFVIPDHLKATSKKTRVSAAGTETTTWAKPSAASGFEPYFAEAPLPPEVAAEEANLYDPIENSFEESV